MVDTENAVIVFTALDRCDACGAQAVSQASLDGGTELLFCLHHRKKHADKLDAEGWDIVDDYEAIADLVGV